MAERDQIEAAVRDHYAAIARGASECCTATTGDEGKAFGAGRYERAALEDLPEEAVAASIGCADPVALAELETGEVVVDLGSGGGIDVLLAARRVGPTGYVYGIDMTREMLELARANQAKAAVTNVEFREGHIEALPLPDACADVVVSNCVVNLSPDKSAVFAEAHRVLRPGGRVAIADLVADRELSVAERDDLVSWAECLAGAVTREAYAAGLNAAGLGDVRIEDSHVAAEGFTSVLVRAVKNAPSLPVERAEDEVGGAVDEAG